MSSPSYTREDQINITVTLDGVPYAPGGAGSWDGLAGGGKTANVVKIRVGGREINIGGPAARDDVTVTVQMSDLVAPWRGVFDKRVGVGVLKVAYTLLDADLNVIDGPHAYVGILNGCTPSDYDKSNSSPAAAKFTIVLGPNEEMAS